MEFLKRLMGGGKKAPTDAEPAKKDGRRAAVGGMSYAEGTKALSPRKVGADEFKKRAREAVAAGLNQGSFDELRAMYQGLGNLQKYSVSSWMAGELPELDQAIRAGDFATYEALKG